MLTTIHWPVPEPGIPESETDQIKSQSVVLSLHLGNDGEEGSIAYSPRSRDIPQHFRLQVVHFE